jgi:hypothetical protein
MLAIMESKNSIIFFRIANVTGIIVDYHNTVTIGEVGKVSKVGNVRKQEGTF